MCSSHVSLSFTFIPSPSPPCLSLTTSSAPHQPSPCLSLITSSTPHYPICPSPPSHFIFRCKSQVHELKQAQTAEGSQLHRMLIDPAVNLIFERMKKQLKDYKEKLEQAQSDLSAWKFTPDRLEIADSVDLNTSGAICRQLHVVITRLVVTKLHQGMFNLCQCVCFCMCSNSYDSNSFVPPPLTA